MPIPDNRFLNHYHCDGCEEDWSDESEGTQDDECPTCGQCYSPYESEDLPPQRRRLMPRLIKAEESVHRFEMTTDGHSKFWEYRQVGNTYVAIWGRIGKSAGGSKVYDEDEITKLVKEKVKKGYKAV